MQTFLIPIFVSLLVLSFTDCRKTHPITVVARLHHPRWIHRPSISSVNAFINVSANAARTKHTLRLNSGIPSSATFFLVIVVVVGATIPSFTTFFALGTDKALDWSNSAEPCIVCASITCSDGRIIAIQNNYLVRLLPSLVGLASLQVLLGKRGARKR
ncbi:hypothetical protein BHE74_00053671 [Ensete ventricosum]|nr:hypothetical protein BHE74_00053671 [Ensete ventricosum]